MLSVITKEEEDEEETTWTCGMFLRALLRGRPTEQRNVHHRFGDYTSGRNFPYGTADTRVLPRLGHYFCVSVKAAPEEKNRKPRQCIWCEREKYPRAICPARYEIGNSCKKRGRFSTVCLFKEVKSSVTLKIGWYFLATSSR